MSKVRLPIDEVMPQLLKAFEDSPSLVLSAAPGAGKTTRVPSALFSLTQKQIWVLEPRRIAAISAAQRIAEENGWQLGQEVGYQVRFDNKSSRSTKLLFLTEALLLRKMLKDPQLKDVGCVVLDEFHERSLHVDLALGALKELQDLERPDLKILVMSATLNAQPLSEYLGGAPVIDAPGKIFPLRVIHEDKPQSLRSDPDFTERMRRLIHRAAGEESGDILCFLPGRGEIERLKGALSDWALKANADILPLHGQLGLQEQREAILPRPGRRKIILATNVAESSLTVSGVRIVVDSGLSRIQRLSPKTGLESLDLVRISKASATQRAGRAAREGEGVVYRAWTVFDERSMEEFETAELFRIDLAEALLLLASLGVTQPESFTWFEAPLPHALKRAQDFLKGLGAIDEEGALTSLGRMLRDIPLHPRLAKLLIMGQERGVGALAADLAALLSEGKGGRGGASSGAENDLLLRLEEWKRNPGRFRNLERASQQLRDLIRIEGSSSSYSSEDIAELLLSVYPDRLCRRRRAHAPEAKMAGGRGVRLHQDSSVKLSEFFLSVELSEGRDASEALVFQAVGIPERLIKEEVEPLAESKVRLEWDKEKQRFWAIEFKEWMGLSIAGEHRRPAKPEEIEGKLAEVVWAQWHRLLETNVALGDWMARLKFLERFDSKYPALSQEQLKEAVENACYGDKSVLDVEKKNLIPYFENMLTAEHRSALERECPSHWVVPTGNRMKIKYLDEQGASVEVRLQELFGLEKAPVIAGQPLTLFLLAPNYRPVQVTRDLPSFWTNGYPEVRKELRMRYPKHSWPEDPRTAPPQAKGRPRRD